MNSVWIVLIPFAFGAASYLFSSGVKKLVSRSKTPEPLVPKVLLSEPPSWLASLEKISFVPDSSRETERSLDSTEGSISEFHLQNDPDPASLVGTVYVKNRPVATFVSNEKGLISIIKIDGVCPIWAHLDNKKVVFEWNEFPGTNYIVSIYCFAKKSQKIDPEPVTAYQWVKIHNTIKPRPTPSTTDKSDFFVPSNGTNRIRLLPPLKGGAFHVSRNQHYLPEAVQCRGGNCPICDHYNLSKSRDEFSVKTHKLKAVERHYYNVLVDGEVKLWSAPKTVHDKIVAIISGGIDVSNPIDGCDLEISKEMNGVFPKFEVRPYPTSSLGTEKQVEQIMSRTFDLNSVVKIWEKSKEELERVVQLLIGNNQVAYDKWKQKKPIPFYDSKVI